MPSFFAADMVGESLRPAIRPNNAGYGGRLRRYRAVINMAAATTSTGSGSDTVAVTTADDVLLARLPAGSLFAFGVLTTSVSLGTAAIAIGTNRVHASNGQLRAAAVFTAVDTPTLFGLSAASGGAPFAADTSIFLTAGVANLPTSGRLVIDLYVSNG